MNAPGIPVFYGAFDEGTSVAEVRAPVGSHVVVARFELLRTVRLLDFDTLAKVYVECSHFDPNYGEHQGRRAFLRELVREVSMPVMPQDETFEYLPTQAVAEYLANKTKPPLDGIVFRSTQTGQTGRNVVLFNHACGVLPSSLPDGTDVLFVFKSDKEYGKGYESGEMSVFVTVPPGPSDEESLASVRQDPATLGATSLALSHLDELARDDDDDPVLQEDLNLQLDLESVVVLEIQGVRYDSNRYEVHRSRDVAGEEVEF